MLSGLRLPVNKKAIGAEGLRPPFPPAQGGMATDAICRAVQGVKSARLLLGEYAVPTNSPLALVGYQNDPVPSRRI
jgi:hypothetical protein